MEEGIAGENVLLKFPRKGKSGFCCVLSADDGSFNVTSNGLLNGTIPLNPTEWVVRRVEHFVCPKKGAEAVSNHIRLAPHKNRSNACHHQNCSLQR